MGGGVTPVPSQTERCLNAAQNAFRSRSGAIAALHV